MLKKNLNSNWLKTFPAFFQLGINSNSEMAQEVKSKHAASLESIVSECLSNNKYVVSDFSTMVDWLVNVVEENLTNVDLSSRSLCDTINDMMVANGVTMSSDETMSVCHDLIVSLRTNNFLATPTKSTEFEEFPLNTQCLALYNMDGLYYPCVVKEILVSNHKYNIEFIDYNGEQQITYKNQLFNQNSESSTNGAKPAPAEPEEPEVHVKKKKSLLEHVQEQENKLMKSKLTSDIVQDNNYTCEKKKKFVNAPMVQFEVKKKHSAKKEAKTSKASTASKTTKTKEKKSEEQSRKTSEVIDENDEENEMEAEEWDEKGFEKWLAQYEKEVLNGNESDADGLGSESLDELDEEGESIDSNDERWINRKNDNCEMCDRVMPLTWHHLIPRMTHKKIIKLYNRNRDELNKHGIWVCRACHSAIHKSYDNWTLAMDYNTLELILESDKIIKWLSYIKNKKASRHTSDQRSLHKMNRVQQLKREQNRKVKKKSKKGDNEFEPAVKYV